MAESFVIDSSEDSWLRSALQKMSMEQLDFFFRCASKLVFGNGKGMLGWREVSIDVAHEHVFDIEFYTNRIEKKFRFSFASEYSRKTILGAGATWTMSSIQQNLLFLVSGLGKNGKKNFVETYMKLDDGYRKSTAVFAYGYLEEDEKLCEMREKLWKKKSLVYSSGGA